MGESTRQSSRDALSLREAVSAAAGADFELATCAAALRRAGKPDLAAKADSLFRAALDFRRQLEKETGLDG